MIKGLAEWSSSELKKNLYQKKHYQNWKKSFCHDSYKERVRERRESEKKSAKSIWEWADLSAMQQAARSLVNAT